MTIYIRLTTGTSDTNDSIDCSRQATQEVKHEVSAHTVDYGYATTGRMWTTDRTATCSN